MTDASLASSDPAGTTEKTCTRRDQFKVEQTGPDTLFVRMNTYDAAIEAKIESRERLDERDGVCTLFREPFTLELR